MNNVKYAVRLSVVGVCSAVMINVHVYGGSGKHKKGYCMKEGGAVVPCKRWEQDVLAEWAKPKQKQKERATPKIQKKHEERIKRRLQGMAQISSNGMETKRMQMSYLLGQHEGRECPKSGIKDVVTGMGVNENYEELGKKEEVGGSGNEDAVGKVTNSEQGDGGICEWISDEANDILDANQ